MEYLIGFIIAIFIALTGVGAGTITTPLLILFLGVPPATAVASGLIFSAAVKLVLVPTQVLRKQVNWSVLGWMLLGGLPGVIFGSLLLGRLVTTASKHGIEGALGIILVLTAVYQIAFSFRPARNHPEPPDRRKWMPWLMFPVGAEVGFSSAGAGALGTTALLALTTLQPAQVVGTDILFGFAVSTAGSGLHLFSHAVDSTLIKHLVTGGIPGGIAGTFLSRFVKQKALRFALWIWLLVIGCQFLYSCATGSPIHLHH